MSDWTFGDVKVRNMEIVALCEREGCRHLFTFNFDQLIEGAGADYKVADIPPMACPACGAGTLVVRLSFAEPPPPREKTDVAHAGKWAHRFSGLQPGDKVRSEAREPPLIGPDDRAIVAHDLVDRGARGKARGRIGEGDALLGHHASRLALGVDAAACDPHQAQAHHLLGLSAEQRRIEGKVHPEFQHDCPPANVSLLEASPTQILHLLGAPVCLA